MKTYLVKVYCGHIAITRHIDGMAGRFIPIYGIEAIGRFLRRNNLRHLYTVNEYSMYELRKG